MSRFFVTGIGTGVGKTLAAAILCEAYGAAYWKPVQAGELDNTDTMKVQTLVSNSQCTFFPETYRLPYPLSPHASALCAGITIAPETIQAPSVTGPLIIEGAGGLMVPLTPGFLIIDLIARLQAAVILVSRHYLGSINHTLLSIEALKNRGIPLHGILFNGNENPETEQVILSYSGARMLCRIPQAGQPDNAFVRQQAALLMAAHGLA